MGRGVSSGGCQVARPRLEFELARHTRRSFDVRAFAEILRRSDNVLLVEGDGLEQLRAQTRVLFRDGRLIVAVGWRTPRVRVPFALFVP